VRRQALPPELLMLVAWLGWRQPASMWPLHIDVHRGLLGIPAAC